MVSNPTLSFTSEPTIEQNPNPRVPLAAVIQFTTAVPVTTTLTISDGTNEWTNEFAPDHQFTPENGLPVVGMRAAREHTITVSIRDEQGNTVQAAEALTHTTPALPEDMNLFPPVQCTVSQPEKMEPGVTLIMARRRIPGQAIEMTKEERDFITKYAIIVAVDEKGEVIWYYEVYARVADVIRLKNGNFLMLTTEYVASEIDILGNTINEWYADKRPQGVHDTARPVDGQTIHHCIYELPNGNFMAFSANAREIENYYTSEVDPDAPRKTQMVMGDKIIEFDRETGEELWVWNTFDYLDPFRIGYETLYTYWWVRGFPQHMDWTHGNSLHYEAADDSVLICLRYQSAILKVDRKTKDIIWILGDHHNWSEELQKKLLKPLGEPDWPYHMHIPLMTSDDKLMLFDNHTFANFPFNGEPMHPKDIVSRAIIYDIDEEGMTVKVDWQSENHDREKNYSYAMGDADEMPQTGNILICYGYCIPREKLQDVDPYYQNQAMNNLQYTMVREVTRTDSAEVVFEVTFKAPKGAYAGWASFGSERIESLL